MSNLKRLVGVFANTYFLGFVLYNFSNINIDQNFNQNALNIASSDFPPID